MLIEFINHDLEGDAREVRMRVFIPITFGARLQLNTQQHSPVMATPLKCSLRGQKHGRT